MSNRRHQLIVLGNFQRRIIFGAVFGSILLVNLVLITWFLLDPQLLNHIDTLDTVAIALVELVIMGLIFYLSLLASNKIAGPMYAFNKVLAQVREGDLSARLHLRHGDICMDVAQEMNATFEQFARQIEELQQLGKQLQQSEGDSERQALLQSLDDKLKQFKTRAQG
jgi:methyl-accepting chemotaxis protein